MEVGHRICCNSKAAVGLIRDADLSSPYADVTAAGQENQVFS